MKILNLFLTTSLLVAFCACKQPLPKVITVNTEVNTSTNSTKENSTAVNYSKSEFNIEGMTCAMGCAKTIEKKLAHTNGVKAVTVDFETTLATIEFDPELINEKAITETVSKVGAVYTVKNFKTLN